MTDGRETAYLMIVRLDAFNRGNTFTARQTLPLPVDTINARAAVSDIGGAPTTQAAHGQRLAAMAARRSLAW